MRTKDSGTTSHSIACDISYGNQYPQTGQTALDIETISSKTVIPSIPTAAAGCIFNTDELYWSNLWT